MKPYEIDSTLKILDIEHDTKNIKMILKETVMFDGSIVYCCIRDSDPYIHPQLKEQLKVLNNVDFMKDIKYNLLGYKMSAEHGLPFLDEPVKQTLFDKIKGVFSGKKVS